MNPNATRTFKSAHPSSATTTRNFRSFLLMAQLEAREIGARIKQARKERGLTQEELAELCDVSTRALQTWEGGAVTPYRHFKDLARLLQRQEEWFLYGDPPAPAEDAELGEVKDRLERIESRLEQVVQLLARSDPGEQEDQA